MTALYATDPARSRGRRVPEEESAFRSPFQRDRDRIIHSSAFRRLKHKTQVFVAHEGDYYRTRLTHSIEVAQVARTISGALGLNAELTEAVAQALRIVTLLERHYAAFDGLNLTWETLEGIAKHNGPVTGPLPYALAGYNAEHDLELDTHSGAEAQVAALSDDIAYNNHDLHDGLRAGLFSDDEMAALPSVGDCFAEVDRLYPRLDPKRRRHEALRRVFGVMVGDVISGSKATLEEMRPGSVEEVRHLGVPVIRFTPALWQDLQAIRRFLYTRMYRAPKVNEMRTMVHGVVSDLFPFYLDAPEHLPDEWRSDVAQAADRTALARLVSDYIAGMTDRFALQSHARLIGGDPDPVTHDGV